MRKIIIAYVPILHEGYRRFFDKHKDADEIFVWGEDLIAEHDYLAKEIRALLPELIKKSLESWGLFNKISILDILSVKKLLGNKIILPDEDVTRDFAEKY